MGFAGSALLFAETLPTANIAAAIGNVHAKRAARFHLVFNILGVLWILILFKPYTAFIHSMLDSVLFSNMGEFLGKANERIGLAIFHTTFNVLNVLILMNIEFKSAEEKALRVAA